MPRGKQSTPEGSDATPTLTLADDAEQKPRTAGAKVTLVKPVRSDATETDSAQDTTTGTEDIVSVAAPAKKRATRPKVGRSAATRKKQDDSVEAKSDIKADPKLEKAEKKSKSKAKTENMESAVVTAVQNSVDAVLPKVEKKPLEQEAIVVDTKPAEESVSLEMERVPASEILHVASLQEEMAHVELTPDWEMPHSRPWSFRSIFIGVLLFVGMNLGFMALFSMHKTKNIPVSEATTHFESSAVPAPSETVARNTNTISRPPNPSVASAVPLATALPPAPPGAVEPPPVPTVSPVASTIATTPATQEHGPIALSTNTAAANTSSAAADQQNNQSQQELFSILNKEQ